MFWRAVEPEKKIQVTLLCGAAVMMQQPRMVTHLLERGADAAQEDSMGLTPLHLAQIIQNDAIWSGTIPNCIKA